MDDRIAPRPFHIMAKPKGAICNLDCAYRFFLKKKEELYPGIKFAVSDKVMQSYTRQIFESLPSPHVTIAWQRGEPTLMGLDFFRRAVTFEKTFAHKNRSTGNTIKPHPSSPGRRAWSELVVRGLEGVFQPHRADDAANGRPSETGLLCRRNHESPAAGEVHHECMNAGNNRTAPRPSGSNHKERRHDDARQETPLASADAENAAEKSVHRV